ncbi:MAG TPA: OmpA family protein [Polyangiaceae bacterium]|nr:OmpA family protein [Polyangiaceae bacterium]
MNSRRFVWASLLIAGCGTSLPPRELVDARSSYEKAKNGQAAQLKPDSVHEAKVALDQAEAAFNDDATSDRTRDLSYIAGRKAELSMSQAGQAAALAQKEQAAKDVLSLQQQGLQKAQGELNQTKQQLAAAGEKLQATGAQLEQEKKARQDAEKRARDAMDKLAVAAALAVKEESRGTVITLPGSVLFQSAKWDLLPAAQDKLNQVAEALKNQADHKMVVEGHTDSQGTEASNDQLSQRRAQTVRDYLVSRGVPSDIISASGVGQHRPIADNKSPEGRANNRRVEIIVQPIEKR